MTPKYFYHVIFTKEIQENDHGHCFVKLALYNMIHLKHDPISYGP